MSNTGTTNLNPNQIINRRSFLMNTIKAGALFAFNGPLLLSKKALAGEFKGETLSLLLIQPHKVSGEILAKRFEEQAGAKLNVTIVPYDAIEAQASLDVQSGANQFDLFEYWYPSLGSLVENRVLTDVPGLIQRDESQIHTSDFIPTIYDPYTRHRRIGDRERGGLEMALNTYEGANWELLGGSEKSLDSPKNNGA